MQVSYRMDKKQYNEMLSQHRLANQRLAKTSKVERSNRKYEIFYKGEAHYFEAPTQTEAREQFAEKFGVNSNGVRFKRVNP